MGEIGEIRSLDLKSHGQIFELEVETWAVFSLVLRSILAKYQIFMLNGLTCGKVQCVYTPCFVFRLCF